MKNIEQGIEPRKALRCCRECGNHVSSAREFCAATCRSAFHNRRKRSGADIYDLVMAIRFDREDAQAQGAWSLLCRMAAKFKGQDDAERDGLKSWETVGAVKARHSSLSARCMMVARR